MGHLLAILGLGVVCVLWFLLQRASGREDAAASGTCGYCGGGVCERTNEPCERQAASAAAEPSGAESATPSHARPAESRRGASTLWTAAALAVLLGGGGWIGYVALADTEPTPLEPVTRSAMLMGTAWTITVVPGEGQGAEVIERAVADAFAEVARIEAIMSEWRDDSPITAVNRSAGGPDVAVPRELRAIVERSVAWGERSGGAFDVTWRGMGDVWNVYADDFHLPSPEAITEAMARVDYRRVVFPEAPDRLGLADPGMALGLGGIAKGYAVDRAAAVLEQAGFHNFYVDGGGDVRVRGERNGRPWRVGVRNPRGARDDLIAVLTLRDGAVVTSGDYERFRIVDGVQLHHIIDPRTGWPAQGLISVTVVGPSAEAADALATAAFVLGPEDGRELIESEPNTEALLVDPDGRVHMTSGFRGLTQ
jgi:FAD:protein FMN transferase